MNTVSKKIIKAWHAGEPCTHGNTSTNGVSIHLHNNMIITRTCVDQIHIWASVSGHPTKTTLERLNSVCEFIKQRQRFKIKNGQVWFGKNLVTKYQWIRIDKKLDHAIRKNTNNDS